MGRKCLPTTHASTLFAIFAPDVQADDLWPLGPFLTTKVAEQLAAEGLPADALGDLDGALAAVGKTASRQILGCMNDQAFAIRQIVEQDRGLARADLGGSTVICKTTSSRPASTKARWISSPTGLRALEPRPLPIRTDSSFRPPTAESTAPHGVRMRPCRAAKNPVTRLAPKCPASTLR